MDDSEEDVAMSVLRISTTDDLIDEAIAMFPPHRVDARWRSGDPAGLGQFRSKAGANIFLTEKGTVDVAISRTMRLIDARREVFERLRSMDVELRIDIGFSVDPTNWTRSAVLAPSVLRKLVELNIELEITAYASGADEGETASGGSSSPPTNVPAPPMTSSAAGEGKGDAKGSEEGTDDGDEEK